MRQPFTEEICRASSVPLTYRDIGSALNYQCKGFHQVIEQIELGLVKRLVIDYQDRFVRLVYHWFEQFCERHGTEIIVILPACEMMSCTS